MGMIKLPKKAVDFFMNNINGIFESGNLAEGEWNKKVAETVCCYTGASHAVTTTSNGAGIVALLQIYNNYYGRKKVLLQSNTMYGVMTMVKSGNCTVEGYIDCSCETLMPTIKDVKNAVEGIKDTSSLIFLLTHIGGLINPDIEEIAEYCKKKEIILIEDCAHSYGATHNKKHSGTFGNAGVYSFYSTKTIFAGEGGVVITNDEKIGNHLKKFVIYDRFEQQMDIGINVRQSELQALFLYSVLLETEEIIRNKKTIAAKYIKACKKLNIPYINQDNEISKGNYYKFIILSNDIPAKEKYNKLKTYTSPVYDYALGSSTGITKNHICLPIWYNQEENVSDKAILELEESIR